MIFYSARAEARERDLHREIYNPSDSLRAWGYTIRSYEWTMGNFVKFFPDAVAMLPAIEECQDVGLNDNSIKGLLSMNEYVLSPAWHSITRSSGERWTLQGQRYKSSETPRITNSISMSMAPGYSNGSKSNGNDWHRRWNEDSEFNDAMREPQAKHLWLLTILRINRFQVY